MVLKGEQNDDYSDSEIEAGELGDCFTKQSKRRGRKSNPRSRSRSRSRSLSPDERRARKNMTRSRDFDGHFPEKNPDNSYVNENDKDRLRKIKNERLPYLGRWNREGEHKPEFRPSASSSDPSKEQYKEYWNWRRNDRSKVCEKGMLSAWSRSPNRDEIELIYTRSHLNGNKEKNAECADSSIYEEKMRKKEKKDKRKKKKEKKTGKKSKKRKRRSSSTSSGGQSGDQQWIEITKETVDEQNAEDAHIIGPQLPADTFSDEPVNPAIYGKDMLKGEAAAMAAYIAQGKRIPRRGEIGLSSDEISVYEKVGYVMSGTRHKSMEATRLRKENQVYSAEEKRMLSGFTHEERKRKEAVILSQFRQLVDKKMND